MVNRTRIQIHPTTQAAARLAANRAHTIMGLPLNATAVATKTTGLIAGDARRNTNAWLGATPLRIKDCPTGTDAHSQAGMAMPASAATGTPNTPRGKR